jgi:Ca2+-binding EF-hand superfamily protein
MMTYALFETIEILKFCFFMFDKDKNGFIHKVVSVIDVLLLLVAVHLYLCVASLIRDSPLRQDEFILFIETIHARDKSPLSNIVKTVEQLDVDGDGKFTWAE